MSKRVKIRPIFKAVRHPRPTKFVKWAVVDTRNDALMSEHYFRRNAIAAAGLANSVEEYMGGM